MYGKVERIWPNSTVYIIGGGPSVVGQDLCQNLVERLMNKKVLGVNNAVYLPCTKVLFFGDAKWYWWNEEQVQSFPGPVYSLDEGTKWGHKSTVNEPKITALKRGCMRGLYLKHSGAIGWNRSSGGAAINVAVHLGAKRIVLLGYDMRNSGKKNWMAHEQESTKQNPFDHFLVGIEFLARTMRKLQIEALNASPNSAIRGFRRVNLEDVL